MTQVIALAERSGCIVLFASGLHFLGNKQGRELQGHFLSGRWHAFLPQSFRSDLQNILVSGLLLVKFDALEISYYLQALRNNTGLCP